MLNSSPKFLLAVLFIVLSNIGCQPANQGTQENAQRPNIIFIMTDDHSIQTMSAYDDTHIQTPNLDRIANEGALFTNSFVTNSICAPSRAVMLTGKHSHLNGQLDNFTRFDSSQATLPKYLQKAGYQTALIGKWHLKSEPTGFDHYDRLIGQGNYYNSDFIQNGERYQSEGYVTDVITDKSIEWISSREMNKPFCLFVHHKATHRIWMPNLADLNEFDGVEFEVPENFLDTYEDRPAAAAHIMGIDRDMDLVYDLKMLDKEGKLQTKYREFYERFYARMTPEQKIKWDEYYDPIIDHFLETNPTGEELALWKYQRYMQDYIKCVKSVDENVGEILDFLKISGLDEKTIVVYTSDQGFYMGEHGWFDKRYMYEESLRTPLAIKLPGGSPKGIKIDEMVQNIDYAPTLLELAGVPIPSDMQGQSMAGLLKGEKVEWRDAIYYHYYEFPNEHGVKKHYGVRTDRYKLIHFYEDIDHWELYDLETDPNEMNNRFMDEAYLEIREQLKIRLAKLQDQYEVKTF